MKIVQLEIAVQIGSFYIYFHTVILTDTFPTSIRMRGEMLLIYSCTVDFYKLYLSVERMNTNIFGSDFELVTFSSVHQIFDENLLTSINISFQVFFLPIRQIIDKKFLESLI